MQPQATSSPTADEIQHWLIENIARVLQLTPDEIDPAQSFEYYGMGSLEGVNLIADLEAWLSRPLDATLFWDYPTIAALAHHLAGDA